VKVESLKSNDLGMVVISLAASDVVNVVVGSIIDDVIVGSDFVDTIGDVIDDNNDDIEVEVDAEVDNVWFLFTLSIKVGLSSGSFLTGSGTGAKKDTIDPVFGFC